MENESKYSPDEALEEAAVMKAKAANLFGEKDSYSGKEYAEAEEHLEEMLKEYGTLETVANVLEFEEILKDLDLENEFAHTLTQAEQIINDNMDQIREEIRIYGQKLVAENPKISQEEIMPALIAYSQTLQNRLIMLYLRRTPKGTSISEDNKFTRLMNLYENISAAPGGGGDPGGDPPDKDDSKDPNKERFKHQQNQMLLTAAPASPPPPPPPPGGGGEPKKYMEMDPDNLIDIEWKNGDQLITEPAFVWTDVNGRERQFYYLKLVCTPKGKTEQVTIDLSGYAPGKTIVFEGVKGSYFGASLDPAEKKEYERVRGRAYDTGEEPSAQPYIIGLNVKLLQESEISLATVFHEIGHVALFGPDAEIISKEQRSIFSSLQKPKSENPEIRQIEKYHKVFEKLLETIRETLPKIYEVRSVVSNKILLRPATIKEEPDYISVTSYDPQTRSFQSKKQLSGYIRTLVREVTPEEEAFLKKMDLEIAKIKFLEATILNRSRMNRSEINRFFNSDDLITKLYEVFHERNARAFAVRQIRKLGLDSEISSKVFLEHQMGSLRTHAINNKNPWVEDGPKKFE